MTPEQLRKFVLELPGVVEGAHQGNADFRVNGKIVANLEEPDGKLTVKLTLERQTAMLSLLPEDVVSLPGGWGKYGWTTFLLERTPDTVVHEVVREAVAAFCPSKKSLPPAKSLARARARGSRPIR